MNHSKLFKDVNNNKNRVHRTIYKELINVRYTRNMYNYRFDGGFVYRFENHGGRQNPYGAILSPRVLRGEGGPYGKFRKSNVSSVPFLKNML